MTASTLMQKSKKDLAEMVLVKDKEANKLGLQLATVREELKTLKIKYEDNNKALDKLADDNIKLGAKKDGLENIIEELHKTIDNTNTSNTKLLIKKNGEILSLETKLKAANEEIEKAGQKLKEKQQTIDNYLNVVNTRNKEIRELNFKNEELNSKKDSLESLNYQYQKELDDAATSYVALEQVKNKYRVLAITGFIVVIIISILGIFA